VDGNLDVSTNFYTLSPFGNRARQLRTHHPELTGTTGIRVATIRTSKTDFNPDRGVGPPRPGFTSKITCAKSGPAITAPPILIGRPTIAMGIKSRAALMGGTSLVGGESAEARSRSLHKMANAPGSIFADPKWLLLTVHLNIAEPQENVEHVLELCTLASYGVPLGRPGTEQRQSLGRGPRPRRDRRDGLYLVQTLFGYLTASVQAARGCVRMGRRSVGVSELSVLGDASPPESVYVRAYTDTFTPFPPPRRMGNVKRVRTWMLAQFRSCSL